MPPGTPRSRSFTRFTMRVGLLHLGQSVDFVVSMTFLRSPVFAIFAMLEVVLLLGVVSAHASARRAASTARSLGDRSACKCGSDERDSLSPVYMKLISRSVPDRPGWRRAAAAPLVAGWRVDPPATPAEMAVLRLSPAASPGGQRGCRRAAVWGNARASWCLGDSGRHRRGASRRERPRSAAERVPACRGRV